MPSSSSVLVVGATGATGRHVVHQLLQQGRPVKVIVRSEERMMSLLQEIDESYDDSTKKVSEKDYQTLLTVKEASLLDLTEQELSEQVQDSMAVVQCLGHTMNFQGLFGHPRRLVTDAAIHLTKALMAASLADNEPKKFILMGSDGVSNPIPGKDNDRSLSERIVLFLLRYLLPPHADNEGAASYLVEELGDTTAQQLEWTIIRPTNLINGPVTDYQLFDKPTGGLFGDSVVRRSNVAKAMVDMLVKDDLWAKYRFELPVVYDPEEVAESGKESEL